jgi:hypothetical protein
MSSLSASAPNDVEHAIGQAGVLLHRLVGRDLDLARLAVLRFAVVTLSFSESWPGDAQLPLLQSDTSSLRAVIHNVPIGFPALLLRPGQLSRTHLQHGLDRRPSHHIDQIIDGTLRLLDEVQQRQDQLPLLGQQTRDRAGVGQPVRVVSGNNLIRLIHRWWLLSGGKNHTG